MNKEPLKTKYRLHLKILSCILILSLFLITGIFSSLHHDKSKDSFITSNSNDVLVETNLQFLVTTDFTDITKVQAYNDNSFALSPEDINYYSSLPYEERVDILFNDEYLLEDRIQIFLSDDIENIGLIYYDLTTSEDISINESKEFIAASTYKVGLNLLFYYLANIGQVDLNEYIDFTWEDYEEGTGILQTYSYLDSFTIQELLDLSLIYSDNIATNMLGRYLGDHTKVRELLYEVLNINFPTNENIITANIENEILKYIYLNRDNHNFSHMIDILTQTEFHDRLDLYIPQEIVAHKIGTYDTNIHDVGIILTDSPYILSIYTNNIENAEEKIALISKAIYLSKYN